MVSLSQINFSQLIDLGFVALVSFVCIRNIFSSSPDDISRRAEGVRTDLRELESALRDLIGEAAAASGNLDRSLNRRKAELEGLLQRIEARTGQAGLADEAKPAVSSRRRADIASSRTEVEAPVDLPNDSWVLSDAQTAEPSAEQVANTLRELIEKSEDTVTLSPGIERLADRARASSATAKTPDGRVAPAKIASGKGNAPRPSLGAALAKKLQEAKAEEEEYIPNFIEPGAFRVAKRLLQAGQEIHVVSRKLDMPVADVRVIERLIRGGWEETPNDSMKAVGLE